RADLEIADLYEVHEIDVVAQRVTQPALDPTRVGIDTDPNADLSCGDRRVTHAVNEADLRAQRQGVLDRKRDACGARRGDDGAHALTEHRGGVVPRCFPCWSRPEIHASSDDPVRRL